MCQISRATVIRANRKMIERKATRPNVDSISIDGSFRISVLANGRVYYQIVTDSQMREAFGEALKID